MTMQGNTAGPSCDEEPAQALQMEVPANEEVMMRQIGNLRQWMRNARSARLALPPVVDASLAVDTIRQLGLSFSELAALKVAVVSPRWKLGQQIVGAVAELISLQSLKLEGGAVDPSAMDLHVLTGLKGLTELRIRPHTGRGFSDTDLLQTLASPHSYPPTSKTQPKPQANEPHSGSSGSKEDSTESRKGGAGMNGGVACVGTAAPIGLAALTRLRVLEFRGCMELMSDEGLCSLTSLTALRELAILPIGLGVSCEGVTHLCVALTGITSLKLGVAHSGQGDVLKGALPPSGSVRELGLAVTDPQPELPGLLTTCTLCLLGNLTSLSLPHLKADDATFMVALGTLTSLTQLRITVAAATPATPPFVINLSTLSQLRRLQHLEVAVVGGRRVGLPITLKLLSCCALAWPCLSRLLLTCMTSPTPAPPSAPTATAGTTAAAGAGAAGEGATGLGGRVSGSGSVGGGSFGGIGGGGCAVNQHQEQQQQQQQQQQQGKGRSAPNPAQPKVAVGAAVQGLGWFVQPECLDLLDAFPCLTHLSLLAPLSEDTADEGEELSNSRPPEGFNGTGSTSNSSKRFEANASPAHLTASSSGSSSKSWWLGAGGGEEQSWGDGTQVGQGGWFTSWLPWSSGGSVARLGPGAAGKEGAKSKGSMCSIADGSPLIPMALHRLPHTLQHLVLERAALWHHEALLPAQQQGSGKDGFQPVVSRCSSAGGSKSEVLLPELRSLELAQCEATDDLMKLLFTSAQKLSTLELIEVQGVSAASMSALSTLISLQHLSVHLHGCSPRHPSYLTTPTSTAAALPTNNPAPEGPSDDQRRSSGGTGVGGLLWGLLGYSRGNSQDGSGYRQQGVGDADQPSVPQLTPRDLWPIVRELPGLRHLQWVVWHQGKKAGQLQLLPGRVRRRVRAAEPPASSDTYGAAAQHRAQQQQQQLQQYWSRQYQQQMLLQQLQQLQQQQPSLPPSASSPALSSAATSTIAAAGAQTQSARSTPKSSRSLTTLPVASSDVASGQLNSAGLVAAAAAAKAGAASTNSFAGSGQPGLQPAHHNSSCWIAPPQAPPKELPSYCALGSWPSALYLAALLQHLPDLHLAYIDMREGRSKVAPSTSTPPSQTALSKSSSSSSLLGGAFMARSSSTPVIAHSTPSSDHQNGAFGYGRDASKQSSSAQQGVDMIFTGGKAHDSGVRESERGSVQEAERVVVAGPLCYLPSGGLPPWPAQDPWVDGTYYSLDA